MKIPEYSITASFLLCIFVAVNVLAATQMVTRAEPEQRDVLLMQIPDTMTAIGYRCQLDTVYPDEAGRQVEILVNAMQPAGTHTVSWQLDDMPNGVYFVRLETAGHTATRKIVVIK